MVWQPIMEAAVWGNFEVFPNTKGANQASEERHMSEQSSPISPRATLDRELAEVQGQVLEIGDLVLQAVDRALEALRQHDPEGARAVIAADAEINERRFEVEERCLSLIATQQPAAKDLRTIVAAIHMVSDLERMGDHAVGIAKAVVRGEQDAALELPPDFEVLAKKVRAMFALALEACREKDAAKARSVAALDDPIDEDYKRLFQDLLGMMADNPEMSGAGVRLQFASHNLERIADRATNLAERVIFQTSGEMQELNPEPDEADIR